MPHCDDDAFNLPCPCATFRWRKVAGKPPSDLTVASPYSKAGFDMMGFLLFYFVRKKWSVFQNLAHLWVAASQGSQHGLSACCQSELWVGCGVFLLGTLFTCLNGDKWVTSCGRTQTFATIDLFISHTATVDFLASQVPETRARRGTNGLVLDTLSSCASDWLGRKLPQSRPTMGQCVEVATHRDHCQIQKPNTQYSFPPPPPQDPCRAAQTHAPAASSCPKQAPTPQLHSATAPWVWTTARATLHLVTLAVASCVKRPASGLASSSHAALSCLCPECGCSSDPWKVTCPTGYFHAAATFTHGQA